MIGAEVEHEEVKRASGSRSPRPPGQRRSGVTRRTPPARDIATARRLIGASSNYSAGGFGFLGLRRLSPPNMKISEFSTSRSAIAVAMVVLKRMLPQSENGGFNAESIFMRSKRP